MTVQMRGDKVLVRTFGDQPVLRRVWDATRSLIYICSDRQYELLVAGEESPPPIGFPSSDVYRYDEDSKQILDSGTTIHWGKLNPYYINYT